MKALIPYLQYLIKVIEDQPEKPPLQQGYLLALKSRLKELHHE